MPLLKIEHLKKHFGPQLVLDDVSIDVEKGEILCVIGESGGGKSVILKHIIGLLIPDGGRILFEDKVICSPVTKPSEFNKSRRHFGMLFQGAALFDSMTVGENLRFPLREHFHKTDAELDEIVEEALNQVGLKKEFQEKMPSELSGGMRSRVGLARAIVMKPTVMLYDEPTSALDPIRTDTINDLIMSLRDKLHMTSIVVTHDMGSAYRIADKIAMLYQGKIIFYGTPAEIRASRNPYIQQFISGRRKLHYAITAQPEEKEVLSQQVDLSRLRRKADITDMLRRNRNPAIHDTRTGLPNAPQLRSQLAEALQKARSTGTPFILALGTVDFYKQIETRYGAEFRDTVMQGVAAELRNGIRGEIDSVARYSEDTFAIVFASPNVKGVRDTADRIRSAVARESFNPPDSDPVEITMSFGLTVSKPDDPDPDALIQRALNAVKVAQEAGHNRVEVGE